MATQPVRTFREIRKYLEVHQDKAVQGLTDKGVDVEALTKGGKDKTILLTLCQTHGVTPFDFELPFKKAVLPEYKTGRVGAWLIEKSDVPLRRGYFSGVKPPEYPDYVLKKMDAEGQETTWMSLSPMEVESMYVPVQNARGRVVVGGLGMGLWAANLLANQDVGQVQVYEQDPDIIAAFEAFSGYRAWSGAERLEIINRGIFEPRDQDKAPDTLLLDIWPQLGQKDALSDVQRAAAAFGPIHVGWWGQELDFMVYAKQCAEQAPDKRLPEINPGLWEEWKRGIGLDVLAPEALGDYLKLMDHVALNVTYMKWPADAPEQQPGSNPE